MREVALAREGLARLVLLATVGDLPRRTGEDGGRLHELMSRG
jgi:hypothetical protein